MLSAMEQVAELTPRREPIRVVVVDDQELFRRGLIMLVAAEEDIEVVGEASDGDEAAELAASTVPDVVLMDVRMPKRSGIEACRTIKQVAPDLEIRYECGSPAERNSRLDDSYRCVSSPRTSVRLPASTSTKRACGCR